VPVPGERRPQTPDGDPTLSIMMDVLATMDYAGGAPSAVRSPALPTEAQPASVGELFWDRGYVADAPTLPQTLEDLDRHTAPVMYCGDGLIYSHGGAVQTMTEADALRELKQYLGAADAMLSTKDDPFDELLRREIHMLDERLFFMGNEAFHEGAAGIAALWRTYLERDPNLDLIVPYAITIPVNREYKKSQELVVAAIMRHFPADDPLRNRICLGRQGNPLSGHHAMIIATDDCVKTGLQITDWYRELRHPGAQPIEVHLLAASEEQLDYGLTIPEYTRDGDEDCLPVAAYYRVGSSVSPAYQPRGPLVTGAHTTVDFNFGSVLREVANRGPVIDEHGTVLPIPALARVERQKRSKPSATTEW
jgi:hypothetical protein